MCGRLSPSDLGNGTHAIADCSSSHGRRPGTVFGCSLTVKTDDVRIPARRTLRHRRREHLGVMDRGSATWHHDKPEALGHHGTSLWCRWIDFTPVSTDEGPRHRPPGVARTGCACPRRGRTNGAGFLRRTSVRTSSTRGIALYRPHPPICRDLGRGGSWRSLHRCKADRARAHRDWCPWHCLGRWGRDWIAAEHRPRHVCRRWHVVGLLHRGLAESEIGRASRCCYCGRRVIDHLPTSLRLHVRDQFVQCRLARPCIAGICPWTSGRRGFVHVYWTCGQHSWRVERLSVRSPSPSDNRAPGHSDTQRMASDE
jgi:hypothetical protein